MLPHDPIQKLEENLWAVSASLPRGRINRRMSVVRLGDGRLVFHNAVPLEEAAMREVEAFGSPSALVVPNGFHRLDIHAWKQRYPQLAVVCPAPTRPRVERLVPVDGGWEALPRDPALEALPLPGTRWGEAALLVRSSARASLLFGDAVMNIPRLPGGEGLLWRLLGSSGGPRVTPLTRLVAVRDASALAGGLAALAATPGLARLVPSHGDIVASDAPRVLREVAARLRGR